MTTTNETETPKRSHKKKPVDPPDTNPEQEPVTNFRHPADPPVDSEAEAPSNEELTGPPTGRTHTGWDPQTAFNDVIINVEEKPGSDLLNYLDIRRNNQSAASTFDKASSDIKETLKAMGHYSGKAIRIRVLDYLINLPDESDAKDIDAFTRKGAQRISITHSPMGE